MVQSAVNVKEGSLKVEDFCPPESPEADSVVEGHGGSNLYRSELLNSATVFIAWSSLSQGIIGTEKDGGSPLSGNIIS